MSMPGRVPLTILIALAACTWALALAVLGTEVDVGFFRPLSLIVMVVAAALAASDRWVWRWPVVRLMVRIPDLEGTWQGTVQSNWKDPETGTTIPPVRAFLAIRQTLTALSVTLYTTEATSVGLAAGMLRENDGRFGVSALYRHEPSVARQARNPMHHGGLRLAVGASDRLKGGYWTDRGTLGDMDFARVSKKVALDLESALAMAEPRSGEGSAETEA